MNMASNIILTAQTMIVCVMHLNIHKASKITPWECSLSQARKPSLSYVSIYTVVYINCYSVLQVSLLTSKLEFILRAVAAFFGGRDRPIMSQWVPPENNSSPQNGFDLSFCKNSKNTAVICDQFSNNFLSYVSSWLAEIAVLSCPSVWHRQTGAFHRRGWTWVSVWTHTKYKFR